MTPTLIILCLAVVALVAFGASAVVGLGLRLLDERISRLAPAAQSRIYLLAALLPAFLAGIVLVAALAPSFGWIADHCGTIGEAQPQHHPHVCAEHTAASLPALSLIALAAFVALRFAVSAAVGLYSVVRSASAVRRLTENSDVDLASGAHVLPISGESQAFVIGLLRPKLFVTAALVDGSDRDHLDAVLAHEQAHIRRRDPLRRLVARVGLAFHLPLVSRALDRSLTRAQELAADREAADCVGTENVARAVVALARSRRPMPRSSIAFAAASIETRVRSLMDERPRHDWPKRPAIGAAVVSAVLVVGAGADAVHHGVEMLLGVLGG